MQVVQYPLLLRISVGIGYPPVPVAVRTKAYVCGRSPAEIVDSNPVAGMDVYLL